MNGGAVYAPLRSAYHAIGYYVTLLLFGLVGLTANVACLLVGWIPPLRRSEPAFRAMIRWLFRLFLWWLRTTQLCVVEFRGEFRPSGRGGMVVVANHPGLMDAVYLLAHLPNAICIFKPAIGRNPILGAASRCAGYLSSDAGIDLIRAAADKVASGACLIVFPEGTRTPVDRSMGDLKPGFAAIVQRSGAPLQLVHISGGANLLARDWRWWVVPRAFPAKIVIDFGPQLMPQSRIPASELVQLSAAWFQTHTTRIRSVEERVGAAVSPRSITIVT